MGKKEADIEEKILERLALFEETAYRIGKYIGVSKQEAEEILHKMKCKGLIHWRSKQDAVRLKNIKNATADTSIFPKPWWKTPEVGFYDDISARRELREP